MRSYKDHIRSVIHSAGYDIHRLSADSNPSFQLLKALKRFNVDLIFDIGANVGQFSSDLRSVGYKGKFVSFEPLSVAHRTLVESARRDETWLIHSRGAIGERDGEIEIHIAGNSVSSSVLNMLDAHSSSADGSAYVETERTPISKLDTVAPSYLAGINRPFLKIDTQGYEWQVLDGAVETLSRVCGVLCELSLIPLYEDQRLWMDMIRRLEGEGFTLWSIQKGFTDARDGRTLQIDAVFFRV